MFQNSFHALSLLSRFSVLWCQRTSVVTKSSNLKTTFSVDVSARVCVNYGSFLSVFNQMTKKHMHEPQYVNDVPINISSVIVSLCYQNQRGRVFTKFGIMSNLYLCKYNGKRID